MGIVTVQGMDAVQIERTKRNKSLQNLMLLSFDKNNHYHITALKRYIDDFEFSTNQMYLYQAMSEGLKAWGGVWMLGAVLPVPEFITPFMSAFLYFGAAGYILEQFSLTDYFERLEEMKSLYNWCMKNGERDYKPQIGDTAKLAQPEIQRLIKSLAPLCSVDFMLAWKRETVKVEEDTAGWNAFLSSSASAVTSVFTLFAKSEPGIDLTKVRALKIAVETRSLDVGAFKGFEQAMAYFVTNLEFREMLKSKITYPLDKVKDMLPLLATGSS